MTARSPGFARPAATPRRTRAASAAFPPRVSRTAPRASSASWPACETASERPGLHFLHIALPHNPWEYLPSGQAYPISGPDIPGLAGETWSDDPWFSTQAQQRYLLQLGFADRLVGRLVRRLREQGLYERSLLIVTADHGIAFTPGRGRRTATGGGIGGIANVPLFVKKPGQRSGRVEEGPALTIDVLPTVADALGAELAGRVDGRPLPRNAPLRAPLRVHAFGGGEARIGFSELVRRRDAEAARRLALFGAGNGFAGVFGAGPRPELVGREVAATRSGDPPGFEVEFDFRPEYAAFAPGAPGLPAFVTGRLSGAASPNETVAVAVNGRVAAVTRSYRDGTEIRMGALVPPSAFRAGANRVEAFAVGGPAGAPVLARAGRAESGGATLARRGGGVAVVPSRGPEIAVEPGVADGYVDSVSADGGRLSVAGWATDAAHRGPVDSVLLFADGRLVQAGRPTRPTARPDPDVRSGGPARRVRVHRRRGADAGTRLRVFAVVDGRASELRGASSRSGPDGSEPRRCPWATSTPDYARYHDEEWGRPVSDDRGLYERLTLEAFQSGLSWLTILRKREAFRAAFAGFDIEAVAAFGARDVRRLMADAGIVRNRAKIDAAIANARAAMELDVPLAELVWSFRPSGRRRAPHALEDVPAVTPESTALAKELKRRGFRFLGPTTAYASMQACGIVNDHLAGCFVRREVEDARATILKPRDG